MFVFCVDVYFSANIAQKSVVAKWIVFTRAIFRALSFANLKPIEEIAQQCGNLKTFNLNNLLWGAIVTEIRNILK